MVLSVKELKAIAKQNKVPGYGKMKKKELQNVLLSSDLIREQDIKKIKPEKVKKEVVEIPESEKKIYCGINELNKKQRRGTEEECIEKKQVKYYGLNKVDETKIPKKKTKQELKDEKQKLQELIKLRIKSVQIPKQIAKLKERNELLKLNNDEKSINELNENIKKIKTLEDQKKNI